MSTDLYGTLKGHQLTTYKPTPGKKEGIAGAKYRAWEIHCTCGWKVKRLEKVFLGYRDGEPKYGLEPLPNFRDHGPQHLYQVWQDSQQGRLDV